MVVGRGRMVEALGRGIPVRRPASAVAGLEPSNQPADMAALLDFLGWGQLTLPNRPPRSPVAAWGWPSGCWPGPCSVAGGGDDAAVWLLSLPLRLLAGLGLRRCVILACLLVLVVTAYGVAEDVGLVDPPAQAAPAPKPTAGHPGPAGPRPPTSLPATCACIGHAGSRYRIPWSVLAGIGKVESDHGRARLPGVRSGSNWAGACGPMQIGCVPRQQGRQRLVPLRPWPPPRPRQAIQPPPATWSSRRRAPSPGPVRLQPLPVLRRQGQAARPPLRPRGRR